MTTATKHKRIELTPARKQELGEEIAEHVRERNRLLDHKRNWVKQTNEAIKYREGAMADRAQVLLQGFEEHEQEG